MVTGILRAAAVAVVGLAMATGPLLAQEIVRGERYTPTIWVDPDGCEHWVMDDGWEGYMDARIDKRGRRSATAARPAA